MALESTRMEDQLIGLELTTTNKKSKQLYHCGKA